MKRVAAAAVLGVAGLAPTTAMRSRSMPSSSAFKRIHVGLPPAWVGVGELDLFHDEDVDYAERLKACGVLCELVTVSGMYHGADGLAQKALSLKALRAGMVEHLRTYL